MAESEKRDGSSVSLKEKNSLLDLDIGKDFLTSWKSMSMEEGDILEFDLAPVSKGNKKSFHFDKVDMDFNLDGDFGKMSSFNMDMSDLDISLPLKKEGKSKETMKESSSGKDKGKTDRFAFAFDFDELENFSFESSLTKEGSKAQRDKNSKESSLNGSTCQDKEGSMHINLVENTDALKGGSQKPSLPGTVVTFDMDSLVGGSADPEPTRKNCPSNLGTDDADTSDHSAAIDGVSEVASDKSKNPPETTIASMELPKISQSEKLVFPEPADVEACTGNDAMQELLSDYHPNNVPSGGNSSEAQDKSDSMDANATGSNEDQDVNVASIAGLTCNYNHKMSENSQHLKTVAVSEKTYSEKNQFGVEDHVIDNREKSELGQVNSLVETSCTTSAVSGMLHDTPSGKNNQEPAPEILKLPVVSECSQPANLSEKETENGRESLLTCSSSFIQSEKHECPVQKASIQTTFSSLSSKKMGFTQRSLVEGRRDLDITQSDKKLVSLPLQYSKTLLRKELPQIWNQDSCQGSGEVCSADGLQNGKKVNDSSTTQNKDILKTKTSLRQREMSMKDLDTLSMEINKKAARDSGNLTTLVSIPTIKSTPAEEHKLSSIEGRKTPDLPALKLPHLNLDSTKSPIQKDIKSIRNTGQNRVPLRTTPSDIVRFVDLERQTPSALLVKRKTLEEDAADIIALHPSKRLFKSPTASRYFGETSEKVLDRKVPNHNKMEDDRIKSTIDNRQVSALISHELNAKGVEMSFSFESNSNIKQAEAYSKELDDLCNMLRKKHDEAKEILVQAIVNSNKLLMLNNPLFEEKISFKLSSA